MTTSLLTGVVIVNWNTGEYLHQCLVSLDGAAVACDRSLPVVVVDNASIDESVLQARRSQYQKLQLNWICNPQNNGFAKACNQGRKALPADLDWVWFLNPDTRASHSSLQTLLDSASAQPQVGIIGLQLRDEQGRIQPSCSRAPRWWHFFNRYTGLSRVNPARFPQQAMTEWPHDESRVVPQVMGACLFIRTCLFDQLQGFDQRYFVYFEEVDLCLRSRRLGWQVCFNAEDYIVHAGGVSSSKAIGARQLYNLDSRLTYFARHHTRLEYSLVAIIALLLEIPLRLIRALFQQANPASLSSALRLLRLLVKPGYASRRR